MGRIPHVFASREDAVDALIADKRSFYSKADRDALMVMSSRTFQIVLNDSMKTRDKVYSEDSIEDEDDEPVSEDSIIGQVRSAIKTALGKVRRGPAAEIRLRDNAANDPAIEAMSIGEMGTAGHSKFGKQGDENVKILHSARKRAADYASEVIRRQEPRGERAPDREAEAMTPPTTASFSERGKK